MYDNNIFHYKFQKNLTSDNDAEEKEFITSKHANIDRFPNILDINHTDHRICDVIGVKPDITIVSEYKEDIANTENPSVYNKKNVRNKQVECGRRESLEESRFNLDVGEETENVVSRDFIVELKRKSTKLVNRVFKNEVTDLESSALKEQISEKDCQASAFDLFRYPNIRRKFLILTFDWLSLGVIYNSLSYNTSNLGVNDYIAFFIGT